MRKRNNCLGYKQNSSSDTAAKKKFNKKRVLILAPIAVFLVFIIIMAILILPRPSSLKMKDLKPQGMIGTMIQCGIPNGTFNTNGSAYWDCQKFYNIPIRRMDVDHNKEEITLSFDAEYEQDVESILRKHCKYDKEKSKNIDYYTYEDLLITHYGTMVLIEFN